MGISIKTNGGFEATEKKLQSLLSLDIASLLQAQGQKGVTALASATPKDSGKVSTSWGYEITRKGKSVTISWTNTDVVNGFAVAIMIQHGHGTGTGGYVQGRDYINPAIRPVFDDIAQTVWRAVNSQ